MNDRACVDFLQWCLPRLRMRWAGFRRVRGQVCKRIGRRLRALGLSDVDGYRAYLETHPDEWRCLDAMCQVTISRFYRDRAVFDRLVAETLPVLATRAVTRARATRTPPIVHCWSAGCGAGEEPYTLSILWRKLVGERVGEPVALDVRATGVDAALMARASRAVYPASSLKHLPPDLAEAAFDPVSEGFRLRDRYREGVHFIEQDIRGTMPDGPFDLVMCRNLVFTYYEDTLQHALGQAIVERIAPRGVLVVGAHETLPRSVVGMQRHAPSIYVKVQSESTPA